MKAFFYCKSTYRVCATVVHSVDWVEGFLIDRPTLRRLFKRLSCDDVNKIFCDCHVYYSYPTIGRPYKEFKRFKGFVLREVE